MRENKKLENKKLITRVVTVASRATMLVLCMLSFAACKGDDDGHDSQEFEDLQHNLDIYKASPVDEDSFTEASYEAYIQALNAAAMAVENGNRKPGEYAALLVNLQVARNGLVFIGWTPITDYLPQCAMLIVTSQSDMPASGSPSDEDLLAAFAGEKCVGLAGSKVQPNGQRYFFLQVLQDYADEYNTDIQIVLKYYSATENRVYLSEETVYINQLILGSYNEPYKPQWK